MFCSKSVLALPYENKMNHLTEAKQQEVEWNLFELSSAINKLEEQKAYLAPPELDWLDGLFGQFANLLGKRRVRNRSFAHIIAVWVQRLCFGEMP